MMLNRFPHPVLLFSYIGHSLDHIFMLIYPTAVIAMTETFGWSYGEMVALMTPSVVLFGAGAIPAGWLADRWSARGMLVIMFFGLGGASVLTGLARTPLEVGLGLAAIGTFASIYHPVATTVVVRYATRRGRDLGINGVFGGLGMVLAPFMTGILTTSLGWRAAFVVPGVFGLAVGLAFVWMVREITPGETAEKTSAGNGGNGRSVLPVFIAIVVAGACVGFLFQTETVAMPKVFEQRLTFLGGSLSLVGGFAGAGFLLGAAAQFGGGLLADRFSMKRLLFIALAVEVPITLLAAQAWDWPLFALTILMVVFTLGLQPVMDSLVAHYVPPSWHARAFGARFLVAIVIGSAAVPAVGWIFDATGGFGWMFIGLGGIAAVGALVATLLPSERRAPVPAGPSEAAGPAI